MQFKISNENKSRKPFPHLLQSNALPESIADELLDSLSTDNLVNKEDDLYGTKRYSIPAAKALSDSNIPECWKELVEKHVNKSFFFRILETFGTEIFDVFPNIEDTLGKRLNNFRVGVRGIDTFTDNDILLDAQVCFNTPPKGEPRSARKPHVDDPRKLFSGLYYLRFKEDLSEGGDLLLYETSGNRVKYYNTNYVSEKYLKISRSIPYEHNTLAFFIDGPLSIHGVSERSMTEYPRVFLNIIGEVSRPLYDLKGRQDIVDRIMRRLNLRKYDDAGYLM